MPTGQKTDLIQLTLNTIRGLSMDAVESAKSGHPGLPMGATAIGYTLFAKHLVYDPQSPNWFNRDRFVLSAGHGSMLLYSLLFLTGYDLPLEELKNFRQWGSKTPGHPENNLTPGVEMATGPLGQGFGSAIGMAIAEERLRAEFPGLVEHKTYVLASDGDMMEGVNHESAALAGHLKLGSLIVLYDSNKVTIDGSTDLAFTEEVSKRYEAYGWHVQTCDGMNIDEIDNCLNIAKSDPEKPHLIICHTIIGYGSPSYEGTERTHGAPLGEEEVKAAKRRLGIPEEPLFHVPDEVIAHMREVGSRSRDLRIESENKLEKNPELKRRISGTLPECWQDKLPKLDSDMATRAASGKILNSIAQAIPELMSGSADLTESNQTDLKEFAVFTSRERAGKNIHYGVREHAMGCAINGMNLHGGLRAYGGTFLIFSDYMRPTIRFASLLEVPSIFVFTHDSIGLGEDGPTHQPIEHLASLRAIPHLKVFRPADANETKSAWICALNDNKYPTAIVLTRQKVSLCTPDDGSALRGGYILKSVDNPQAVLIGTGSEVEICLRAQKILESQNLRCNVVSLPCWELFEEQPEQYKASVIPKHIKNRVSVEAGATLGWERWVGENGVAFGLNRFGASAPYERLYKEFGFTPENIANIVLQNHKKLDKGI